MGSAVAQPGYGRQALVLLGGVVASIAVAAAIGAPFDIDVGAGHAIFHLVFASGVGLTALLFWRRVRVRSLPTSFARWSLIGLTVGQLLEAIAAIPDPEGDSTPHAIPNEVTIAVLQPLVLVSLFVLLVAAVRSRRPTDQRR